MVQISDLRVLLERIKTTKARYKKIIGYRGTLMKERETLQKAIIARLIGLLKKGMHESQVKKSLEYLKDITEQLVDKTERNAHSLEVLKHVIEHRYHLPLILHYLKQVKPQERALVEKPVQIIQQLFEEMKKEIDDKLIPNAQKQMLYLKEFIRTENVTYLFDYISLFREEKAFLEQFAMRIRPSIGYMQKAWVHVKAVIKKPATFGDDHRMAVAIFVIALSVLSIGLGLVGPVAGGIFGGAIALVHGVTNIGEEVLHIYHLDHAAEILLER